MELDRARIAVRQRAFPDILDLALRVVRARPWPLGAALAAGAAPWIALNAWLLGSLPRDATEPIFPGDYVFWMCLMVAWEAPMATAPTTLLLGQWLFGDELRWRETLSRLLASLPQLALFQGVLRAALVFPIFTAFIPLCFWPYLNEVILLDRNPLRARRAGGITTYRRAMSLHRGFRGDLFLRALASAAVAAGFAAAMMFSIALVRTTLLLQVDWNLWWDFTAWDPAMWTVYLPATLWTIAGFFAVVRFLAYLDLRIRREGWEVELLMRAEGARLERQQSRWPATVRIGSP